MMSAAAGYSTLGKVPIVTCYGVFASMRAIEQARNSIAYPDFNVKVVASHLGLDVGPDGVSHQALEDLAIYRSIPNFVVISPADDIEIKSATECIIKHRGPVYMRTGRSPVPRVHDQGYEFKLGKGTVLLDGHDVAIVATGVMVHRAIQAAQTLKGQGINPAVINLSSIKPIDHDLINAYRKKCRCMVTCEDHNVHGGLFSAVLETIAHDPCPVIPVAIKDEFAESGESEDLAKKYGIHIKDIVNAAIKSTKSKHP